MYENITIELISESPLLMHADVAADPLSAEARWLAELTGKKAKSQEDLREISRRQYLTACYTDGRNRPCIPIDNVHSCLYAAAKKRREGPIFVGSFIVTSTDFWYGDAAPATPELLWENPDYVDRRSVAVMRARLIRTRPIFPDWKLNIFAEVDRSRVDNFRLEEWIAIAGKEIGLCDYRPQRGGLFGRFGARILDAAA